MDLYIDSANLEEIQQAKELGVLDGVTTNPSLVAKEGVAYPEQLKRICEIVEGPVSAEVLATDAGGMLKEAKELAAVAKNVVIKLPCTRAGLKICKALSDQGQRTNMTLCFQPLQAWLVAKAGAYLVSPFLGRLDDIAEDGIELIHKIRAIYDNHGYETKLLAASLRHSKHLVDCALAGADVVTVPFSVIAQAMKHPLTDLGIERFVADYRKAIG